MIDVRRLSMLQAVAEHGSFNRAAGALLLTPSAVSQQIAALERGLGTAVVERSTRGVRLTEAGRLLVEAAGAIDAELRNAREQIGRLGADRPRLTLATFTSGGRHLLPAVLARFAADHPEAELRILEREPEDSLPMVREGTADLALAYHFDGPLPVLPGDRSGLDWTPLMDDPLSVVLPDGHPLADRDAVDLAELAGSAGCWAASRPRTSCAGTPHWPASNSGWPAPPPTTSSPARWSPPASGSRSSRTSPSNRHSPAPGWSR